jgi:hypothetical protein
MFKVFVLERGARLGPLVVRSCCWGEIRVTGIRIPKANYCTCTSIPTPFHRESWAQGSRRRELWSAIFYFFSKFSVFLYFWIAMGRGGPKTKILHPFRRWLAFELRIPYFHIKNIKSNFYVQNFFLSSQNRSIWGPKNSELYADFRFEGIFYTQKMHREKGRFFGI